MRKRVYIALAVLLVILAGVSAWQVLRLREPVYQGKPLSAWLERLSKATKDDERDRATTAIRHIGTNALPLLIERLRAQDAPLKLLIMTWAEKQKLVPVHLKSAQQRRNEAIWGYEALGPLASAQIPSLADMVSHDPAFFVRHGAVSALGYVGPEARSAAPALFRATQDTDEEVRGVAFWALGRILPDPQLTIPLLVAGLDDPLWGNRWPAAAALGKYGPEARAAVPALLRALATNDALAVSLPAAGPWERDQLGRLSDVFRSALKKVDPEAAAEAGVK